MAKHSHWARIKRKKAVTDKRRGKLFSKLAKAVIVAARAGGGDPETNLKLKYAIKEALAANVTKDVITRNIKRGTGEIAGEEIHNLFYEGYAPGGVAVLVECLTDNRNRTPPEIRRIFEKRGGNLGTPGSVAWMFTARGMIRLEDDVDARKPPERPVTEEAVFEVAAELGADDVSGDESGVTVACSPDTLGTISNGLSAAGFRVVSTKVEQIPDTMVPVADVDLARTITGLLEDLEEYDDVQEVFANLELDEEVVAQL